MTLSSLAARAFPFEPPRGRALGAQKTPADPEPRLGCRFGRSAVSASSRFSAALARCNRCAAAFSSASLLAAASSASASRSSLVQ
jgi:hypothetical protein